MEERDGGLWFLVRNRYLVFLHSSWLRAPKPLSFLKWWEPRRCLVTCGLGWLLQEPVLWLEVCHFHSHPPTWGMPEGQEDESTANGKWFSNVYIMKPQNKTKQITLKGLGSEASGLVNTWKYRDFSELRESMEVLYPLHISCLTHVCYLDVPDLYSSVINQ